MAAAYDGRWEIGIGDPTATGWITVLAYGAATVFCYLCQRRSEPGPNRRFWFWMALTMALLGINKQLDLQTWLTQTGRDWALEQGWYERRRLVQVLFVGWLALLGLVAHVRLVAWLKVLDAYARLASAGLFLLGVFVMVRAVSFHHIDQLLRLRLDNVSMNVLLELSGICVVAWAAVARWRSLRSKR